MSCESWGPLLAAEFYGDNFEADHRALTEHLGTCSACRSKLEFWRTTLAKGRPAPVAREEAFWILQKTSILERLPKRSEGRWLLRGRWLTPVLTTGLLAMASWNLHRQSMRRDVPIAQNMEMLQNMDMLAHLDVLEAMDPSEVQ